MSLSWLLIVLLVGLLVGILAQVLMGGHFGWVLSIILGLAGSVVGGFIFRALRISIGTWWITQIIAGVIGACLILFVVRLIKR